MLIQRSPLLVLLLYFMKSEARHLHELLKDPDATLWNNEILSYKTETHSRYEVGLPGKSVQGWYSFLGQDGKMYTVNYLADEKGFRATVGQTPTSAILIDESSVNRISLPSNSNELDGSFPSQTSETNDFLLPNRTESDKKSATESDPSQSVDPTVPSEETPFTEPLIKQLLIADVPRIARILVLPKHSKGPKKLKKKLPQPLPRIIRYQLKFHPNYKMDSMIRTFE